MSTSSSRSADPRGVAARWLAGVHAGRDLDAAQPAGLSALDSRDRALTRRIVMTALRRRGQIKALLDGFLDKRPPGKAGEIIAILHIGIAQIVFLETPPHAAVSTAVALAKRIAKGRFAGLVNAVLRRCVRDGAAAAATQDAPRLNTPDWLWRTWCDGYGETTARAIAEAHVGEAPLDITVARDVDVWARRLGGRVFAPDTVRLGRSGAVEALDGFDDGAWWVQDRAAAVPARLLGDVGGRRVLDLCAAPGGKTAQLAATGADTVAVDRDAGRMDRLRANMARLRLTVETHVCDAMQTPFADGSFDAVLLDAPCSATGTIRRRPDLPWRRRASDIAVMAETQAALLAHSARLVKPGGHAVYATCSLQPEEGRGVIEAAMACGAPLAPAPLDAAAHALSPDWITADGDLRTLPCFDAENGGMDGFFAARLVRT